MGRDPYGVAVLPRPDPVLVVWRTGIPAVTSFRATIPAAIPETDMLIPSSELEPFISWDGPELTVGRWPVYVDFETSVLDRDQLVDAAGASVVPRRGGIRGRVRALVNRLTTSDVASRANVGRMIELLSADRSRPTVLVVGGGAVGAGVEALYTDRRIRLISFDVYTGPNVQFVADAHRIPLDDASVDGVLVQAVLEHVLDPWQVVAEIHRVLRPGGVVYAETPFLQHVHEGAYDFTRFTESGHRWLFRHFRRVDSGAVSGPGVQMIWSVGGLVEGLTRSSKAGTLARIGVFWLRFLDRLIPPAHQVDGACGVYFLGRRSAEQVRAREMPREYRGAQGARRDANGSREES